MGRDPATWLEAPAFWDASGGFVALPIPTGYDVAHATRINRDGDISGSVAVQIPGGWDWWAIVWIRRGLTEWEPVVLLDGGATFGITDRRADGTLLVAGHASSEQRGGCCQAVRWSVSIGAPGGVTAVRESLGTDFSSYGGAHGVNEVEDMVGLVRKGAAWNPAQPALFAATGSTVVLPVPGKGSSGSANEISADRWVVGTVDGRAAVWHP